MSWTYSRKLDRLVGHDFPGAVGPQWFQYELDELELGGRVAAALDEEEQWWWELETLKGHLDRCASIVWPTRDSLSSDPIPSGAVLCVVPITAGLVEARSTGSS